MTSKTLKVEFASFLKANPLHGPDAWATSRTSWCLSLLFRFNGCTVPYATAAAARRASGPLGSNCAEAPVGAIVYFSNNHAAQVLEAGPNPLLGMASHHLSETLVPGAGYNTLAGYIAATRAKVLGWAMQYGQNPVRVASDTGTIYKPPTKPAQIETDANLVRRVARYLNGRVLGNDTAAASTGVRGRVYWTIMQRAGKQDGLYGRGYLVTGIPGPRTLWLEQHYATITR